MNSQIYYRSSRVVMAVGGRLKCLLEYNSPGHVGEGMGRAGASFSWLGLVYFMNTTTLAVRSPGSRWFPSSEGDWRKVRTLQSSVPYENEGR